MKINWTITFGDILTALTIIISIIALIISLSKDRQIRKRELANKVREAATVMLTKLDRWKLLSLSLFDELQPIFVETSELLAKDFNIILTRDYLWRRINETKTKITLLILQEEIETAYASLYSYNPYFRRLFLTITSELKTKDEGMIRELLELTQKNIFSFEDRQKNYTTAMLGNVLRDSAYLCQKIYINLIEEILDPITDFLAELILKSDNDIIKKRVSLSIFAFNQKIQVKK